MSKKDFLLGVLTGLIISGLTWIFYLNLESADETSAENQRGEINYEMTRAFREKLINLEKAAAEDPENIHILTTLGNYYFDAGEAEKAIDRYEKVLEIEPNDEKVLVDCGVMYRELKKFEKSLEYFDRALAIEPDNQQALFNKVIVYRYDLDDIEKAKDALRNLENYYPDNPHVIAFRTELGL